MAKIPDAGGLICLSATVASAISKHLDTEEIALLSAFLSSLNSNLVLIAQRRGDGVFSASAPLQEATASSPALLRQGRPAR